MYVAYFGLFGTNGGLQFIRSRDGGVTWSNPARFDSFGWPFVAIGAGGKVHLSHYADNFKYGILTSSDGGDTFGPQSIIATVQPGSGDMPRTTMHQIIADTSRGILYAVIPGSTAQSTAKSAIWFTRSTDSGATWSPLRILSSAQSEASLPAIAVDATTGELVVSWLDRRDDGVRARVYATRSLDGGVTLETVRPFSDAFPVSGPIGDYNQVAAQNGKRVAVFADSDGVFSSVTLDFGDAPQPAPKGKRRVVKR